MSSNFPELSPNELRYHCDESQFDFESTAELPSLPEMIGQERALRAIDFGISIPSQGFNIYALGPVGSGKTSVVKQRLQEHAKQLTIAVNNAQSIALLRTIVILSRFILQCSSIPLNML